MIILLALNNQDQKYKNTRHNLGRLVLEFWIKGHDLPQPKMDKKLHCWLATGAVHNQKIIYGWPSLYMNESGLAIRRIANRYKLKPEQIWILHDDIDIKLGKLKIAQNRGAAGHHGVESVIKALGTKNFTRLRFGIQPESGKTASPEKFVLQPFTDKEKTILTGKLPEFAIAIDKQVSSV